MSYQANSDGLCLAHLAGDIDVAVAALGAARCAESLPAEFRDPLRAAQRDLHEIGSALAEGMTPQLDESRIDRLDRARREYSSQPPPDGFAVLGGTVDSVGLLQLARALVRRAAHPVRALTQQRQTLDPVLRYLDQLDRLLVVFAYETELQNEAMLLAMSGTCGSALPETGSDSRAH
jgi:cob(I)alamin adenosyltransferase